MAISNGFDEVLVLAAASSRIGFRNGVGDYNIVDTSNQTSDSGRYYQDFHKAVTLANLKQTQENAEVTDADFNVFLANERKAVVNAAINGVFSKPMELDKPRMLFDRMPSTEYRTEANSRKFVGYKIRIAKGFYAARINTATFFFNGVATFNLYLFQDGKIAPIKTKSVTTVANEVTVVDLSDWTVRAVTTSQFYVGYFQEDLGSIEALDVPKENEQCFKIIGYESISAAPAGSTNFDRTLLSYSANTYGLNLEISTYHDYTNELVKNIHLFDNLFGLQMAIKVIEQIQYNNRTNKDERDSLANAQMMDRDLNMSSQAFPETPFTAGLKEQYNRELARVYRTFFPKPEMTSGFNHCEDHSEYYHLN